MGIEKVINSYSQVIAILLFAFPQLIHRVFPQLNFLQKP